LQVTEDPDGFRPTAIGSLEESKKIELSIVLAQVCEEGALQLNDYILHLLAGHTVAVFEPAAHLTGVRIPLCHDLFFAPP
jgi:hypothetical protein